MGQTAFTLAVDIINSGKMATLSIIYEVGDVSFASLRCGETEGVS